MIILETSKRYERIREGFIRLFGKTPEYVEMEVLVDAFMDCPSLDEFLTDLERYLSR